MSSSGFFEVDIAVASTCVYLPRRTRVNIGDMVLGFWGAGFGVLGFKETLRLHIENALLRAGIRV